MGIFSFFSRAKEPDYDTYLASVQTQIQARQARLQQIRLRERRANVLFITYGIGLWVLYGVLWWFTIFGGDNGVEWVVKAARTAPVVGGPFAIIFTRRFMRWYYHRKEAREDETLKALVKQKQDKVEEIKKKTGYYSTRDLLEKYDEALRKNAEVRGHPPAGPSTPSKQPVAKGAIPFPTAPSSATSTPIRTGTAAPILAPAPQQLQQQRGQPGTPASGATLPTFPPPPPPQPPLPPQPRSLMDKLADALLGVSAEEANPYNKYALICAKCYAHNGLVPKEQFDFVQYQCPRCGYFNARRSDPAGDASRRRVQSLHHPSPLRPSPLSESEPGSRLQPGPSPEMQEIGKGKGKATKTSEEEEQEEEEDKEVAETLLKEESGSTGTKAASEARQRGGSARKGAVENDQDRMDTD
ncbi:SPOSA6832_01971, partial [Sporobolomyces salmonicolor]